MNAHRVLRSPSALAVLAAVAFVVWGLRPGHRVVWSRGPLSSPHAFLGPDCGACHVAGPQRAQSAACARCHDAAPHPIASAAAPACAACHDEHAGLSLRAAPDAQCTRCHTAARGFPAGHPELRAVAAGRDPGGLRFNHGLHHRPDLRDPEGQAAPLACGACHAPADAGTFAPPRYEAHCARCHRLSVPHGGLADVAAAARASNRALAPLRNRECALCHRPDPAAATTDDPRLAASPVAPIVPVRFPTRPPAGALFSHRTHRALECLACHEEADRSSRTADVLLPGIASCASCHQAGGRASAACVDCHRYHGPHEGPKERSAASAASGTRHSVP
jgi:hypothetical protein